MFQRPEHLSVEVEPVDFAPEFFRAEVRRVAAEVECPPMDGEENLPPEVLVGFDGLRRAHVDIGHVPPGKIGADGQTDQVKRAEFLSDLPEPREIA